MGETLDRAESTETGLNKVVTHPRHGIGWDNGGTDLIQDGAEGCQDQIMCDRPGTGFWIDTGQYMISLGRTRNRMK